MGHHLWISGIGMGSKLWISGILMGIFHSTVKPTSVNILDRSPLKAGHRYQLSCISRGSKPPANITWWKGNKKMELAHDTYSEDRTSITSVLTFEPTSADNNMFLACRAQNLYIPGSAIEDGFNMQIYSIPHLKLETESESNVVTEKITVYFKCIIQANPWVTSIGWRYNGQPIVSDFSNGISIGNQSLVVNRVSRHQKGVYSCVATNSQGEGQSNPIKLIVQCEYISKIAFAFIYLLVISPTLYYLIFSFIFFCSCKEDAPICVKPYKSKYGLTLHETASIICKVEANPPEVDFKWTFNSSSTGRVTELSLYSTDELQSIAVHMPRSEYDYGQLNCYGRNSVGFQSHPCTFNIIHALIPYQYEPVLRAGTVSSSTESSSSEDGRGESYGEERNKRVGNIFNVRKSAVYKVNKNGASTVPCGAPVLVFIISEYDEELRRTNWERSVI
ncbi:Cell adhesion molecule 3 [Nymphon striatum]|nr:Cell adhesion molecule 3 [Nymphon striatum]